MEPEVIVWVISLIIPWWRIHFEYNLVLIKKKEMEKKKITIE
jgi:hypothetical protein